MEIIRISNEMEQEAFVRGKKMVENGLYDRMGFEDDQRIDKAKLGCIGELAFSQFLTNKGIAFEIDTGDFSNRHSDEFDFRINGKRIDVKVAKTIKNPQDSWTYGYPVQQIGHDKEYVVVGAVNEKEKTVSFYGWILFSAISNYPKTKQNKFAGFSYSTENYEFPWGDLNKNFDELINECK